MIFFRATGSYSRCKGRLCKTMWARLHLLQLRWVSARWNRWSHYCRAALVSRHRAFSWNPTKLRFSRAFLAGRSGAFSALLSAWCGTYVQFAVCIAQSASLLWEWGSLAVGEVWQVLERPLGDKAHCYAMLCSRTKHCTAPVARHCQFQWLCCASYKHIKGLKAAISQPWHPLEEHEVSLSFTTVATAWSELVQ